MLGLKPDWIKSEFAGIVVLKGVQVAVCGTHCINLSNDTFNTHFSYNGKLKEEKYFYKTGTNIQQIWKIWKMKNLTLEGKIVIFKTIAMSKIVFQLFKATVPEHIVNELKKYTRNSL